MTRGGSDVALIEPADRALCSAVHAVARMAMPTGSSSQYASTPSLEECPQICIHDLRATFETIAFATEKTEAWVANRTGQRSSKMINEYRLLASCHEELTMRSLDPLTEVVPEFAALIASSWRSPNPRPRRFP